MRHEDAFRASVHRLTDYDPGRSVEEVSRRFGVPVEQIAKLASNESSWGPPPVAIEAITKEISQLARYPWQEFTDLKQAVARFNRVDPSSVVLGSGSESLVQAIPQLYVNPGDEVIVAPQSYVRYEESSTLMDAVVIYVPLRDYCYDIDSILAAVTPRTKIIWICSPNNPTGTIVTSEKLAILLSHVPITVAVVIDQAYHEFVEREDYGDGLMFLRHGHRNVIALRTFSKAYGMAGVRLGYALADPLVCRMLDRIHEPFFLNRAATAAGLAALGEPEWMKATVTAVREQRLELQRALQGLGLDVVPSEANFLLVDVKEDALELFERLMARGVIVRPASGWGYPTHIRVTVGKPEENHRFLRALHEELVG